LFFASDRKCYIIGEIISSEEGDQMFNALYDKATHHCNECNWDGDGWELKNNKCPNCKSKNIEEIKE
jgi:predicted Zn-ribbon and HTH transcriptional regulator